MIVWTDLETGGLDPETCCILEIAVVVTDDDLTEIGEPFVSLAQPLEGQGYESWDLVVKKMHRASGLMVDLYESGVAPPQVADVSSAVCSYIIDTATDGMSVEEVKKYSADGGVEKFLKETPLAGSSIHFDRAFLRRHMPVFEGLFSHRMIDVSSNNEQSRRWRRDLYDARPGLVDGKPVAGHRALADIRASIETAKFYRRELFVGDAVEIAPLKITHGESSSSTR